MATITIEEWVELAAKARELGLAYGAVCVQQNVGKVRTRANLPERAHLDMTRAINAEFRRYKRRLTDIAVGAARESWVRGDTPTARYTTTFWGPISSLREWRSILTCSHKCTKISLRISYMAFDAVLSEEWAAIMPLWHEWSERISFATISSPNNR